MLSWNTAAIHILEANLDKVNWDRLSYLPEAIHILEANLDKVNWKGLSKNEAAMDVFNPLCIFF